MCVTGTDHMVIPRPRSRDGCCTNERITYSQLPTRPTCGSQGGGLIQYECDLLYAWYKEKVVLVLLLVSTMTLLWRWCCRWWQWTVNLGWWGSCGKAVDSVGVRTHVLTDWSLKPTPSITWAHYHKSGLVCTSPSFSLLQTSHIGLWWRYTNRLWRI